MITGHAILNVAIVVVVSACTGAALEEEPPLDDPGSTPTSETVEDAEILPAQEIPSSLAAVSSAWETDFSRATVDLGEILVGIPTSDPRDAIPPIDNPQFESISESTWIADREPGVLVQLGEVARFYPLSVMTRHEIVNDVVGGIPVAVTYCPLCNTAVTFKREFEGETIRLGVSGLLRNSDLVMWDDKSQSLWQQITGEAIVGQQAGKRLEFLPTAIVSFIDFSTNHPSGQAMTLDQGFGIPYGVNPYTFYSTRNAPLSFFQGEIDPRFPPLERVVGVTVDDISKAYAFPDLASVRVVNDEIGGQPVAIFWGSEDTADALDARQIAEAKGVGTGIAFSSVVDTRKLTFVPDDANFVDSETGSTWNILGVAIDGELAGEQLDLVTHTNEFWFAWQAFFPDSEVYQS